MHIRRLLVGLAVLGFIFGAGVTVSHAAPPPNITMSVATCDPWYPSTRCIKPNADGSINVTGGGSNASVGTTGAAAPASATQTGGKTAAGNLVPLCAATDGTLCAPQAATRTLTATNLTGATNTTICPAATNPVVTEIFFTTAAVGIGVNGQTLTTATPGATTTNSPDIYIGTANTLYTFPVGPSNAITAYGAAGVVRCIQTLRQ